jgi:hypothetical protein
MRTRTLAVKLEDAMIQYIKNKNIDKTYWDATISDSINSLMYARSWFLDIVSPGWEALMDGEYAFVMPLPVKQKFFIHYLIQPRFTQQLGVFSRKSITSEHVDKFIENIPSKFIWRDFNLNTANVSSKPGPFLKRNNFELELNKTYEEIIKKYNENTRRNLLKAKNHNNRIHYPHVADDFLKGYEKFSKIKPHPVALSQLKMIIHESLNHNLSKVVTVIDSKDQMIAGAFFLVDKHRIIYLTSFSSEKAKEQSAMFMLVDAMIREFANQSYIFDFEGSMIPGIARFFEGFGASMITYFRYQYPFIRR